jgi:hypothetical protein
MMRTSKFTPETKKQGSGGASAYVADGLAGFDLSFPKLVAVARPLGTR